jgi:hypothetical protein
MILPVFQKNDTAADFLGRKSAVSWHCHSANRIDHYFILLKINALRRFFGLEFILHKCF